jgi:hypothetical protein
MFESRLYLNVVLTVIVALLAWNTLTRTVAVAHAQSSHYTAALLSNPYSFEKQVGPAAADQATAFEKMLNDAAKGGELVSLVRQQYDNRYLD